MASIYDNFGNAFQQYRNKQRLAGGVIDPGVVGALAEADLNARYSDQRSRRSQDLQQQAIDNSYNLGLQNLELNRDKLAADKSSNLMQSLFSLPMYAGSIYGMGKEAGLWGTKEQDPLAAAQTNLINAWANKMSSSSPSLYDYGTGVSSGYGDLFDAMFDFGGSSPSIDTYGTSGWGEDWMDSLLDWSF